MKNNEKRKGREHLNNTTMIIIDIILIFSLLAVVITKIFDVLTTIRHYDERVGEANYFIASLMHRYGVAPVCWGVFALVVLLVALMGLLAFWWGNAYYKVALSLVALLAAAVQAAVARSNAGHENRIANKIEVFFDRLSRMKK